MSRGRGARLFALAIALAVTITATAAYGASTRGEYVGQTDPICLSAKKPVVKVTRAWFKALHKKGVSQVSKGGKIDPHAIGPTQRWFHQLARIYGGVTSRVAAVPPPPGDEALIASWLQARGTVQQTLDASARALSHRKFKQLNRIGRQGQAATRQSNALVRDFGFRYCASSGNTLFQF